MMKTRHRPFWTRRRYFLPVAVALAANVVVYAALTYRLATKQERLAREQASLTQALETRTAALADLEAERERLVRNDEIVSTFWSDVVQPRDPGLTEAWAELDRLAAESGVKRGRLSFSYDDLDVGLVQVSASMPLTGTYFNLVRFINRLERSPRFFLVREIGLRTAPNENTLIDLRCDVSFFLKPDVGEPGEAS